MATLIQLIFFQIFGVSQNTEILIASSFWCECTCPFSIYVGYSQSLHRKNLDIKMEGKKMKKLKWKNLSWSLTSATDCNFRVGLSWLIPWLLGFPNVAPLGTGRLRPPRRTRILKITKPVCIPQINAILETSLTTQIQYLFFLYSKTRYNQTVRISTIS